MLILCGFTCPQIAESESFEFTFTFNCGNEKDFKPCLIGKFPSSMSINLLSLISSSICKAKTLITFDYEEYPFSSEDPLQATSVDTEECKQLRQYTLAYLEKNVFEYQTLPLIKNTMRSVKKHVDKIVRTNSLANDLLKKWDEYLKQDISYSKPVLLSKVPVLYVPIPNLKEIYIVQYLLPYEKKYGPLFFYAKNKVVEIDSEGKIIKMFKLNGRHFVMFDSSCWVGCGDGYTALLEIRDNQYRTIVKEGIRDGETWAD